MKEPAGLRPPLTLRNIGQLSHHFKTSCAKTNKSSGLMERLTDVWSVKRRSKLCRYFCLVVRLSHVFIISTCKLSMNQKPCSKFMLQFAAICCKNKKKSCNIARNKKALLHFDAYFIREIGEFFLMKFDQRQNKFDVSRLSRQFQS